MAPVAESQAPHDGIGHLQMTCPTFLDRHERDVGEHDVFEIVRYFELVAGQEHRVLSASVYENGFFPC